MKWLSSISPNLKEIALLPFDRVAHEEYMLSIGWQPVVESYCGDSAFEIQFPDAGRWLWACYGQPRGEIGTGIYALTAPDVPCEYLIETDDQYNAAFDDSLRVLLSTLGPTNEHGQYTDDGIDYNFALWKYEHAQLMLIQHFEGDGHNGHFASLDVRIWETLDGTPITFPLHANMLF